ncbi:FYVE zinc finger-domain-containing protein [Xylariaceae sp. FL1272]|nr:FYVE zinc finger-domain-containing protein [Xylariaceae sp. FL1272]
MSSPPDTRVDSDHFDSPSGTAAVVDDTPPRRSESNSPAGPTVDSDSDDPAPSTNPRDGTDNTQDTGLAGGDDESRGIESNDGLPSSAVNDITSHEVSAEPVVEAGLVPTTEQIQLERQASQGIDRNMATLESFRNILTAPVNDTAHFHRAESSQAPSQYHSAQSPPGTQSSRPSSSLNPIAPEFIPSRHTSREYVPPPWQPDQEVTYCPICNVQFGMITRKHHCRKCGRVVCGQCSPHRICIPHGFIVRAPWEHVASQQPPSSRSAGGQRVRLCNPCVPDPNTTPPQAPQQTAPLVVDGSSARHRRAHSTMNTSSSGMSLLSHGRQSALQHYPGRNRSATTNLWPGLYDRPPGERDRRQRSQHDLRTDPSGNRMWLPPSDYIPFLQSGPSHGHPYHGGSWTHATLSSRPLPRRPAEVSEEDECPVCHLELPSRALPNFEALRETHINICIATTAHGTHNTGDDSSVAAPGTHGTPPPRQARRTRMFPYKATEKDCVDNAECTICLEEFTVGEDMARLECFCRFHRSCIDSWFVGHPGRCPIHQHDSYGY